MLWIIEGCDRTGKTTLCEALRSLFGGHILHFEKPTKGAIEEYVAPLVDYRPRCGTNIYVDRHFLGEAVWPQFFGRPSMMTAAERYCIELFLKSRGALCVLTYRDEESLEQACVESNEPTAGRAAEAQRMFARAASKYAQVGDDYRWDTDPMRVLDWYDYTHGQDITKLLARARELEEKAS